MPTCAYCEGEFESRRAHQRFCSERCRVANHQTKHEAKDLADAAVRWYLDGGTFERDNELKAAVHNYMRQTNHPALDTEPPARPTTNQGTEQ